MGLVTVGVVRGEELLFKGGGDGRVCTYKG